jgi:hypothetical protein
MGDETVTRGGTALTPCNPWKLPRLLEWYTIEHCERSKRSHVVPGCEMFLFTRKLAMASLIKQREKDRLFN